MTDSTTTEELASPTHAGLTRLPQRLELARTSTWARCGERLEGATGRTYWRSLEEAAETPEFEEMVHREFPQLASEWSQGDRTTASAGAISSG